MSSASSEDNWVTTSGDDDENDAVICAELVNDAAPNAAPQVTRLAEQSATLAEVVTNGNLRCTLTQYQYFRRSIPSALQQANAVGRYSTAV